MIKVVPIEGKGRGVIATEEIQRATIISAAPILEVIPNTSIENHCWTHDGVTYLTLGVQTLVNHSDTPNCISIAYKDYDLLVSIKRIDSGVELTLDYKQCCDEFDGEF